MGDLLDSLPTALSLKAYLPFGGNGFTLIAATDSSASSGDLSAAIVAYAARLDLAFGTFELSEEAGYNDSSDSGSIYFASSVKSSVAGVDLVAEGFGTWSGSADARLSFVCGAFWESGEPRVAVNAEYWYDGASTLTGDHRLALGLGWTISEALNLKAACLWVQAFADGSGTVMPGISFSPTEHVTLSFSTPFSYGESGEVYSTFDKLPPSVDMPFAWTRNTPSSSRLTSRWDTERRFSHGGARCSS